MAALNDISATIQKLNDSQLEKLNLFVAGVEIGLSHANAPAPAEDALPVKVTGSDTDPAHATEPTAQRA